MKYFVYILKSITFGKTYIGITNNPYRRLKEHNAGKSIYTRKFKPWEIVYQEEVSDRKTAREKKKNTIRHQQEERR
jgi:putative endonuclease